MTIQFFIILLVALCAVSSLLTEAIKRFYENRKENPSANLIAGINAIVIGGFGSVMAYIWFNIPFTVSNIVAIIAMIFLVWIGSMVGYDKVIQLIKQIAGGESSK